MSKRGGRTLPISRRCIFCGGRKLTGEHIWPDWAASLLPDATHCNDVHITAEGAEGTERIDKHRVRQGGVKKMKIRAVCGVCNSQWMNDIEMAARADLTAMILGQSVELSTEAQRRLTEWVTLKLMVAEHNNAALAAFSAEANKAFYDRRELPAGLTVDLLHSGDGMMRAYYYRYAMTGSVRPVLPATGLRKNVASVTLGIGELLVFGVCVGNPEIHLDFEKVPGVSVQLFPFSGSDLAWPPPRRISEAGGVNIAETLKRLSGDPRTKWLPGPDM